MRDNIHAADVVQRVRGLPPRAARRGRLQPRRRARELDLDARGDRALRARSRAASWTTRCPTRRASGDHRWWVSDLDAFRADYPGWDIALRPRSHAARDPRRQRRAVAWRVKLSVVIPAHNEAGSIGETVEGIRAALRGGGHRLRDRRRSTTARRTGRSRSSRALAERARRALLPLALRGRLRVRRARRPRALRGRRGRDHDGGRLRRPARPRPLLPACSRRATTARSARASCRAAACIDYPRLKLVINRRRQLRHPGALPARLQRHDERVQGVPARGHRDDPAAALQPLQPDGRDAAEGDHPRPLVRGRADLVAQPPARRVQAGAAGDGLAATCSSCSTCSSSATSAAATTGATPKRSSPSSPRSRRPACTCSEAAGREPGARAHRHAARLRIRERRGRSGARARLVDRAGRRDGGRDRAGAARGARHGLLVRRVELHLPAPRLGRGGAARARTTSTCRCCRCWSTSSASRPSGWQLPAVPAGRARAAPDLRRAAVRLRAARVSARRSRSRRPASCWSRARAGRTSCGPFQIGYLGLAGRPGSARCWRSSGARAAATSRRRAAGRRARLVLAGHPAADRGGPRGPAPRPDGAGAGRSIAVSGRAVRPLVPVLRRLAGLRATTTCWPPPATSPRRPRTPSARSSGSAGSGAGRSRWSWPRSWPGGADVVGNARGDCAVLVALPLAFWALTARRAHFGEPAASRYLYPGVLFLLLVLAEAGSGLRPHAARCSSRVARRGIMLVQRRRAAQRRRLAARPPRRHAGRPRRRRPRRRAASGLPAGARRLAADHARRLSRRCATSCPRRPPTSRAPRASQKAADDALLRLEAIARAAGGGADRRARDARAADQVDGDRGRLPARDRVGASWFRSRAGGLYGRRAGGDVVVAVRRFAGAIPRRC